MAIGNAIRSYDGLERVGLVAGGGLSHFVGEPRVGDIDEEFDRWFLDQLGRGDLSEILAVPNDELAEAGNGTGEVRAWVALAAAMGSAPGKVLAYEAGLRVDQRHGRRAVRRRPARGRAELNESWSPPCVATAGRTATSRAPGPPGA